MSEPLAVCKAHLRLMTLDDVPQVAAIDQTSFSLPWPERSFRFEVTQNNVSSCWVAEIIDAEGKSRLVGMVVGWLLVDVVHIGTLAVHPDFRRCGTGQRLVAQVLIDAYHKGIRQSFLEVRRSNLAAQALYRRFGFQVVSVREHYYRDNNEDALNMNLDTLDIEQLQALAAA
jgi:ribosomal-protein-alanine N-acetyltransferase